jgi:homogentisate 1,2-dioxygenase
VHEHHHGAPERARERARRKFDEYTTIDWKVSAIDTRRRLTPSPEVLAADLGAAKAAPSNPGQHQ